MDTRTFAARFAGSTTSVVATPRRPHVATSSVPRRPSTLPALSSKSSTWSAYVAAPKAYLHLGFSMGGGISHDLASHAAGELPGSRRHTGDALNRARWRSRTRRRIDRLAIPREFTLQCQRAPNRKGRGISPSFWTILATREPHVLCAICEIPAEIRVWCTYLGGRHDRHS